jgi:DnaJ-class molecular chaperone
MKKLLTIALLFLSLLLFNFPADAQNYCTCPKCAGSGMADEDSPRPCNFCNGGTIPCRRCNGKTKETCGQCFGSGTVVVKCKVCYGTGNKDGVSCEACGGDGENTETCISCEGLGYWPCGSCGGSGIEVCNMCGGTGQKLWQNTCPQCSGSGKIECE